MEKRTNNRKLRNFLYSLYTQIGYLKVTKKTRDSWTNNKMTPFGRESNGDPFPLFDFVVVYRPRKGGIRSKNGKMILLFRQYKFTEKLLFTNCSWNLLFM